MVKPHGSAWVTVSDILTSWPGLPLEAPLHPLTPFPSSSVQRKPQMGLCPLGVLDPFCTTLLLGRSPRFIKCPSSLALPSPSHGQLAFREGIDSNLPSVSEPSRNSGPRYCHHHPPARSPGPKASASPFPSLQGSPMVSSHSCPTHSPAISLLGLTLQFEHVQGLTLQFEHCRLNTQD